MALKKEKQSIGRSRGGLTTKIHMITASDRDVVIFSLSSGRSHDAPEAIGLFDDIKYSKTTKYMIMDRAYEGKNVREALINKNLIPIVPAKSNRRIKWELNTLLYQKRNKIERYFARLKRFRRVFTRYDKSDLMFYSFILFAIIFDVLISVNTP